MKTLKQHMYECHVRFPAYGARGVEELDVLTKLYEQDLSGYTAEQIDGAFVAHIKSSKQFPTGADLIEHLEPKTCYRMDFGPLGYGAVYTANHPYVRQQARHGTDIGQFVVEVSPAEHRTAKLAAQAALPASDRGNDPEPDTTRRGSGFARLAHSR